MNQEAASKQTGQVSRPQLRRTLGRGARRMCPHCGRSTIFDKRRVVLDRCAACGFEFAPNPGDAYIFIYVTAAMITGLFLAGMYFGQIWSYDWPVRAAYFGLGVCLMIGFTPHRTGLAVSMHYLSRAYFPDPADVFPPVDDGG